MTENPTTITRGLGLTESLARLDQIQIEARNQAAQKPVPEQELDLGIPKSIKEVLELRALSGLKRYSFVP